MSIQIRKAVSVLNKTPTVKEWAIGKLAVVNHFYTQQVLHNETKPKNTFLQHFVVSEKKGKETFLEVIRKYVKEKRRGYGHADFIRFALKYMEEFDVHQDLEVYKALLQVFPKGDYIPENRYQVMMYHYPKQQETAMALLRRMEEHNVMPDYEMQEIILNIFGESSHVIHRYWRMMYWMPKFCELNPWPLPVPAPKESKVLAEHAISKICSIDVQAKVTVYRTKDIPDSIEDTWIVSSMSRSQQELLAVQPIEKPLFVEGPFSIWVAKQSMDYFVLKGEPIKREIIYDDYDDVSNLKIPFWEKLNTGIPPTIHEQEDGVYYATCATGTSSKDSLLSWIRYLQKTNPILEKIPVVFRLKSSNKEYEYIQGNEQKGQIQDTKKLEE